MIVNMADARATQKATSMENNAIYYEVSPAVTCLLRLFNVMVAIMTIVSFVLCLVKGHENNATYYLLACNTVISAAVCSVVNWWYRSGDLSSDKYWYIFLVGAVIIFQCITTDVFVFHNIPPPPTVAPSTRLTSVRPTLPRNITSMTIHTLFFTPIPSL